MTRRVAGPGVLTRRWPFVFGLGVVLSMSVLAAPASAQESHLLLVVGVAGDEARAKQFTSWAVAVLDAAKKQGVPDANVQYLGERPEQSGGRMALRATRENVTKAFGDLAGRAKANDDIFILLIGHGSFDGKLGAFNLPGPDLSAADYATLLDRFATQRIAFVNTASSSGAFLQPLAGPARTIVAATKTGGERNETEFAGFFVEALDHESSDRDRNGRVSVLEAFDYAAAKVKSAYEQRGLILTEHATLDDGSQGKLAATQYLAPERSRTAAAQTADPALRVLLERQDTLERQVAALRLRKDAMPAEQYDKELEQLVTDLAVTGRSIRDFEAKQGKP